VLLAATVALMSVMDESALDALYRSVNTITTAGEVSPPKQTGGRLVTMLVLMSGVSIFLYVVGLTIELVVGGVVSGTWQRRRMESRIARLNGHHIICGCGRVGGGVAPVNWPGRAASSCRRFRRARARASVVGRPCVRRRQR
jgi:voltage-gated potassium channel